MRRRLAVVLVLVAALAGSALLGPVLTAAPARADNGTSSVGCSTGDSCEVMLEKMVTFGGANYSPGASNLVVNITPPPCLWEPIGDGTTGSQAIVSDWGKDPAQAPTDFGIDAFWLSHEPWIVPEPFTPEVGETWAKEDIDEWTAVLELVCREAYESPEVVRSALAKLA